MKSTLNYANHNIVICFFLPLSLLSLTLLSSVILSSTYASADDDTSVVDEVNLTVPVSCTMSGTGMNTHEDEISNGTYKADIGITSLHAFCNDAEGFAIYAAGYTGDEIGGANSNKLVGTSASGNSVIETGLATSAGNPDVSNWTMKLAITQDSGDITGTNAFTIDSAPNISGGADASFAEYHVVPNEYTKVAHKTAATDMTAVSGGAKLTTTYAVYISKTQPADTYSGQVIYTLVHPASAEPSQLTPPTSCTTPVPGLTYMQDLTSSNKTTILSNMTEDAEYYLADKRDDKTYCVAKLRDGNLWMTQNLDHDIVTDGSVIYDNTTTDIGWNGTSYGTASWTPASATKATSDTSWTVSYYGGDAYPQSYDPGELYWNGTTGSYLWESDCIAAGGTWDNVNSLCNQTSSIGNSHYHLGNYYNWTAAVAMNNSGNYTVNNTDVDQSICPAGWTLPKSSNNASSGFSSSLMTQYGWNVDTSVFYAYMFLTENPNIWNSAIKLPLSGGWHGQLTYDGLTGRFWSSSVLSSAGAYSTLVDADGHVELGCGNDRTNGNSVRCLAR